MPVASHLNVARTLFTTDIENDILTSTESIILEKAGENKYTITWTQPSGDDRALTIPALSADDQFTFNAATQTLTNKNITVTGLNAAASDLAIFAGIAANTLTIGASGTTVRVLGSLTVSGTTTTLNTATLTIEDSLYILNHGTSGSPTEDAGFVVERGDSTNVAMLWDESADEFVAINTNETGTTAGNVTIASYANMQASAITAASLDISGNIDVDGTTNLDAVDIDGAVQIDASFISGVDGQGYDTKFFGDTSGAYILWDTSADKLLTAGGAVVDIVKDKLLIGGTAVTTTAAELNLLDTASANSVVNSKAVIYGSSGEVAGTLSTAAQGNVTSLGTLTALTVDDITIDGSTISDSGALTVDIGGNIDLDTGGTEILLSSGGTQYGRIGVNHSDLSGGIILESTVSDKDVRIRGNDGGSMINALHFDMSSAGGATFYAGINATDRGNSAARFYSSADSGDVFKIDVTTHGATTLTTIDDDAAAANLQITADGTVDIDSAGVLTLDSGAAINIEPASGSAILLDGTISIDAGVVTGATSITSTAFVGDITGDVTGTADTATVGTNVTVSANNSANETVYPTFVDRATGTQGIETDTGLTYNPSTGVLTTTSVTGNLTGNVTGNTSGTAATVTTAAQGNITSLGTLTTLTVDNIIINGTTIGHTSATDAMTIASSGAVTFKSGVDFTTGQDIIVGDDLKMTTDDAHIAMGADTDLLISHRGLALAADAELGGVIVGTSDHPGVAANSMIISNQTTDGDIMLIGSDGGNSVAYYLLDSSANTHYFSGTTNLQAIDVNGASQFDNTVTVGVDDTGHDVKFFGASASAYMLWDESVDDLLLSGEARMGIGTTNTAYGYLSIDAGGAGTRMVRLGGETTTT